MTPIDELSDSELDEAVARECMGWTLEENYWWHDSEGKSLGITTNPDPIIAEGDAPNWSPTTDARDAEMVWDWLSQNLPEDWRMAMTSYHDSSGGFCLEVYDDARKIWGSPFPELDADWAHPGEAVAMYKRALCLAALAVARRGKEKL